MDNTNISTTETAPEIQKTGLGPKFNLPNKIKAIIVVSVLILLGGFIIAGYQNRKDYISTTGALIQPTTYPSNDPYVELDKLINSGEVQGDGFNIKNVSRSTKVAVFLNAPYDKSQEKFQAWLKANGYGEIPQEKIVYFHNP